MARVRYEEALQLYMRIPEPYSIGQTHRILARIAENEATCQHHVSMTRNAWLSIQRDDLVQNLDIEFPDGA
jgi:hypothetical protein